MKGDAGGCLLMMMMMTTKEKKRTQEGQTGLATSELNLNEKVLCDTHIGKCPSVLDPCSRCCSLTLSLYRQMSSCPAFFSKTTFGWLLLLWLGLAAGASYLIWFFSYAQTSSSYWIFMGNLTSTSISFRIRYKLPESSTFRMYLDNVEVMEFTLNDDDDNDDDDATTTVLPVYSIEATNLTANTEYTYTLITKYAELLQSGTFQTAPEPNSTTSFSFVASSCANTGSKSEIFDKIMENENHENNPFLFMLHLGDFHYEDLNTPSVTQRLEAFDRTLGSEKQRNLYANLPIVYMWDDHDYLGNNLGGIDAPKENVQAAMEQYRSSIPYYSPLGSDTANYHAFTIGRVRFVICDTRSELNNNQIISEEQELWIMDELSQSDQYDFVIWSISVPWNGKTDDTTTSTDQPDKWSNFPAQRERLSNFLSTELPKNNVLAIAGDAHMLAFDDGSNTYFGNSSSLLDVSSFPILQTGPLDRMGSIKGGPYSDGCSVTLFERNHQYSVIDYFIADNQPCLLITGYSMDDIDFSHGEVFRKQMCGDDIFSPVNNDQEEEEDGSCTNVYVTYIIWIVFGAGIFLLFIAMFQLCKASFLGNHRWILVFALFLVYLLVFVIGGGLPWLLGASYIPLFTSLLGNVAFILFVICYLWAWHISEQRLLNENQYY